MVPSPAKNAALRSWLVSRQTSDQIARRCSTVGAEPGSRPTSPDPATVPAIFDGSSTMSTSSSNPSAVQSSPTSLICIRHETDTHCAHLGAPNTRRLRKRGRIEQCSRHHNLRTAGIVKHRNNHDTLVADNLSDVPTRELHDRSWR